MTKLSDDIKNLHKQGKSYNDIVKILCCSKGTISYHLGKNQKQKTYIRQLKHRNNQHPYKRKLEYFSCIKQYYKINKQIHKAKILLKLKIEAFSRSNKMYKKPTFTVDDIINKFGENPKCYLTGKQINIYLPRTYHFDHIVPRSRGGSNDIDNLGICTKEANIAKSDLLLHEFIELCKQVVNIHNKETKAPDKGLEP